jgi:uncharacterized Zn finger protein (UPF0148 family)
MALTAFCPVCQRTVYIEEGDTAVCPVCSTSVLEVTETSEGDSDERRGSPHTRGLK